MPVGFLFFCLCYIFSLCTESEVVIAISDLPAPIISYFTANYPMAEIDDASRFTVDGVTTYHIEVESGDPAFDDMEFVFDAGGTFLGSVMPQEVDIATLPAPIQDYINTNYPGIEIEDAEMEMCWTGDTMYQVDLVNEQEFLFDMQGNLLCEKE